MESSSGQQQNGSFFVYFNASRRSYLLLVALCAITLGFYSCGDSGTGGLNGNGNGNGNGTGEIGTEPVFTNVVQIFQRNCAPCHIGASENGVRLDSHSNVINSVGAQYGRNVVIPGDADDSPLVDKIESANPQFGVRMPRDGSPLPASRIAQIKEWIDNGAEDN